MSAELNRLLREAEVRGRCLAAADTRIKRALDARVCRGELVSPYPKLYARECLWADLNPFEREVCIARGYADLHPEAVLCGVSAAVVHGLQVPFYSLGRGVCVATESRFRAREGSVVFYRQIKGLEPVDVGGVSATDLVRTAFDCARQFPFRSGVAVADSALRLGRWDRDSLSSYVNESYAGHKGIGRVREAVAFADARSANGGESVARAVMFELGFEVPEIQVGFVDPVEPWRRYYADYVWRSATTPAGCSGSGGPAPVMVIGELDGVEKYFNVKMGGGDGAAGAILRERRRESRLTVHGASVMRFSFAEVLDIAMFDRLLSSFGIPRVREPRIHIPRLRHWIP